MKVSVVVPVFNEEATVGPLLSRLLALPLDLEVIVVDDGSTDGTPASLSRLRHERVQVLTSERNAGKGAAVALGLAAATGDVVVVQDADLEYDPADIPSLLEPIDGGRADVVYGVRSWRDTGLRAWPRRTANALMTWFANALYGARLSDLETCYKVFRRDIVDGMELRSRRFGFDPEITAFFLLRRARIAEKPISYQPRTRQQGKKIRWTDLFVVLFTLARCRLQHR